MVIDLKWFIISSTYNYIIVSHKILFQIYGYFLESVTTRITYWSEYQYWIRNIKNKLINFIITLVFIFPRLDLSKPISNHFLLYPDYIQI